MQVINVVANSKDFVTFLRGVARQSRRFRSAEIKAFTNTKCLGESFGMPTVSNVGHGRWSKICFYMFLLTPCRRVAMSQ